MLSRVRRYCFVFLLAGAFLVPGVGLCAEEYNLVILATGDLKGRLAPEMVDKLVENKVTKVEAGGLARLVWAARRARERFSNKVLLFSSGDDLAGISFHRFKGAPIIQAMNAAGYDAVTLGNRSFDYGYEFLGEALAPASFSVVVSNMDISPEIALSRQVKKTFMTTRNGVNVGVIGLAPKELTMLTKVGEGVSMAPDYAQIVNSTVSELKEQGAKIIVGLFDLEADEAKDVIEQAPELDVVILGNSTGVTTRGNEVFRHASGARTLLLRPGMKGSHLGILKLKVGKSGVEEHLWRAMPMSSEVPKAPEIEAMIASYLEQIPQDEVLAASTKAMDLRKSALRKSEVAAGNLICDIVRERFGTDAALINSGGIRGDKVLSAGPIRRSDVEAIHPFFNHIIILTIQGAVLKQALERSASFLPDEHGGFFQVSGLKYEIDLQGRAQAPYYAEDGAVAGIKTQGDRVRHIQVLHDGVMAPLDMEKFYRVATTDFIAGGGDGYIMLKGAPDRLDTDISLTEILCQGVAKLQTLSPETDGRVVITGR